MSFEFPENNNNELFEILSTATKPFEEGEIDDFPENLLVGIDIELAHEIRINAFARRRANGHMSEEEIDNLEMSLESDPVLSNQFYSVYVGYLFELLQALQVDELTEDFKAQLLEVMSNEKYAKFQQEQLKMNTLIKNIIKKAE